MRDSLFYVTDEAYYPPHSFFNTLLKDILRLNEYENFVIIAGAKYIPTEPRAKCKILWESITVREEQENMKKAFLLNKRNPKNANVQSELTKTYQKEQLEYIQGLINKIRSSVKDSNHH